MNITTLNDGRIRVIDENNHIAIIYPGQNISAYSQDIQNACNAAWTPDVIQAFIEKLDNSSQQKRVTSVSMRQARLALLNAGLLDTVDNAVLSIPKANQIEWEFATTVDRNSPLVGSLAAGLGLTEAQLDNLFLVASKL